MKKKFLVLSAMLTLVVSGICLQSCSSEFDSYTTEEYGYYTEEEINAIEALAEQYGLCMEINKDYCGVKLSLLDIEKDIKNMASILGTHEMKLASKDDYTTTMSSQTDDCFPRQTTRYVEGDGSWSGSESRDGMDVIVTISWQGDGSPNPSATGSVDVKPTNGSIDIDDSCNGHISCSFLGHSGITFTGYVNYKYFLSETKHDKKTIKEFATYKYTITNGHVKTTVPYSGSFVLNGGHSGVVTEEY